jgi:hypothetical protein
MMRRCSSNFVELERVVVRIEVWWKKSRTRKATPTHSRSLDLRIGVWAVRKRGDPGRGAVGGQCRQHTARSSCSIHKSPQTKG